MVPEISVVVVTHRSSGDAVECVASLRGALRQEGVLGEIVLVDCGSGAAEAPRLESAGADLLLPLPDNRGYSGGVNAGLARARSHRLLLSNADVVFRPGAIRPLLEAIDDPAVGAAAPLAFWDEADRLRLPPGWKPGFRSDFAQMAVGRRPSRDARRFASHARETLRLWQAGGAARQLSGAVLAARRDVFDRIGRFDERFPFEFEETEWEDRVRGSGLELRFVASARVRHRWGSSATGSAETAVRRARSRELYWTRRYGRLGRALLERAGRRRLAVSFPRILEPRLDAREGAWAAVSTNASLVPFAGAPLDRDFVLPADVASRLPPIPIFLRSFRASDGHPIETRVWEAERE